MTPLELVHLAHQRRARELIDREYAKVPWPGLVSMSL
jgi:hypothetical protein